MRRLKQQIHGDDAQPEFTRDTIRSASGLWDFFMAWLRITWFDILVMSALGGASLGVSALLANSFGFN